MLQWRRALRLLDKTSLTQGLLAMECQMLVTMLGIQSLEDFPASPHQEDQCYPSLSPLLNIQAQCMDQAVWDLNLQPHPSKELEPMYLPHPMPTPFSPLPVSHLLPLLLNISSLPPPLHHLPPQFSIYQ